LKSLPIVRWAYFNTIGGCGDLKKNNLNSNRHGYTFDNVPISFRRNFSLFQRIEAKAIRLFVLGIERAKKGLR